MVGSGLRRTIFCSSSPVQRRHCISLPSAGGICATRSLTLQVTGLWLFSTQLRLPFRDPF